VTPETTWSRSRWAGCPAASLAVMLFAGGCAHHAQQPGTPMPGEAGGASEYRHSAAVTRLALGRPAVHASEFGFTKVAGAQGVFAVDDVTGAAWGVMNADAPALKVPAFSNVAGEHTEIAMRYFLEAGLPKDQVGGAHVTTLMRGGGAKAAGASGMQVQFVGYSTVLERVVAGVPVADSFAWASFNQKKETTAEAVYWPAITAAVVADARELWAKLSDPEREKAFRASLKVQGLGDSPGKVVIRHSNATDRGRFVAFASYDVLVTPPPGKGRGRILHFDSRGEERFLAPAPVASKRAPRSEKD